MMIWMILAIIVLVLGGYIGLTPAGEGIRTTLRDIEQKVLKIEVGMALFVVLAMVFLSFCNFVLRNFITGEWATEFTSFITDSLPFMIMLIGFMGASIGISKREVIQMDVLRRLYPESMRKIWNFFSYFLILAVVVAFMTFAYSYSHPDVPVSELLPAQKKQFNWVNFGFLPIMVLIAAKCILVLMNPQIEQEMDDASAESE